MPDPKAECRTLCLIGTGAVERSWDPVFDALEECRAPGPRTADAANFTMARLVYVARWARSPWFQESRARHPERVAGAEETSLGILRGLREAIGSHLNRADGTGSLSVRREFQSVLDHFVAREASHHAYITTNWDRSVERGLRAFHGTADPGPLLYLHGRVDDAHGIYLPTEVVDEPYRTTTERDELQRKHFDLVLKLNRAHRVVVYGLSISPLDAELAQMLSAGITTAPDPELREIVVVDPCPRRVAERLFGLLQSDRPVPIRCFPPGDYRASTEWTYTPDALGGQPPWARCR